MIMLGDADVMVAGGAEAAICRLGMAGFAAARALSTGFNDTPERASRPWDKDRDGFVMGEGAGVVVLEELEHASARGAKIYAEVMGYGMSGDAYHITAPSPDGDGGFRSMQAALKRAGLRPTRSTTSTPTAPRRRSATRSSWARSSGCSATPRGQLSMSSTKSAIGHLLGPPAASRRSSASWRSATRSCRRRSIWTTRPTGCDLDLVPHEAERARGAGGAVELVRLRRHQRQPDLRPGARTLTV